MVQEHPIKRQYLCSSKDMIEHFSVVKADVTFRRTQCHRPAVFFCAWIKRCGLVGAPDSVGACHSQKDLK